jgi:superfamily II DNA or RNA helicase
MSKRDDIQSEALAEALKYKRCGLGISMGVGKTLIGLKYLEHQYESIEKMGKILVVAPKLSIFDSWKNDGEKFGLNPNMLKRIEYTTYLSLNKKDPADYTHIVLDECHSLLYSHESFLEEYKGYILGLTGTPPRWRESEKGRMVARFCPIIYKYKTDFAVEDQILNDYKIVVHEMFLDTAKNVRVENKGRVWWTSEFDSYEYWTRRLSEATTQKSRQIMSVLRMRAMMDYISKENYAKDLLETTDQKCIVFANTIAQARRICPITYDSENPDSEENLQAFSAGRITKLSCVLQLNEGVNIKGLKEGIIMHAYGNERKSSQRIGRLLRLNPDECATIHILCYKGTIDEKWLSDALKDFDQSKITWIKKGEKILDL